MDTIFREYSIYGYSIFSNCTGGHHLGQERAVIAPSRGLAAKQGFIYTKGVAIVTEISVRYRESGRLQGRSLRGVPL